MGNVSKMFHVNHSHNTSEWISPWQLKAGDIIQRGYQQGEVLTATKHRQLANHFYVLWSIVRNGEAIRHDQFSIHESARLCRLRSAEAMRAAKIAHSPPGPPPPATA